jgi:predicted  nucleic acid-binding Zn-ribbon protein
MNKRAEMLVALQNLDILIREVKAGHEQELGFKIENLDALLDSRRKLAERVPERDLALYERVARRYEYLTAVVPVHDRICLGCFMSLPTSALPRGTDDEQLRFCENCGRILYWV